jgi:hypothetical protein
MRAMETRRQDLLLFLALLAVVLGTVVLAHVLPAAPPKGPPSTAAFGDREQTCIEWTDGCIVCVRGDHGPTCSTPGIACVKGAVQCTRRSGV